jgi:hypothetical protein
MECALRPALDPVWSSPLAQRFCFAAATVSHGTCLPTSALEFQLSAEGAFEFFMDAKKHEGRLHTASVLTPLRHFQAKFV